MKLFNGGLVFVSCLCTASVIVRMFGCVFEGRFKY